MKRKLYQTDLCDAEWALLEPHMPQPVKLGRPRTHSQLEIVNAIFYALRTGCQWRHLPHDFPPWSTVYSYFRAWRLSGLWQQLNRILREQLRQKNGRNTHPSACIIDSQSVKTTGVGGVLPRRWVVERTFAWLGQNRRLSKDYERLPSTSEALIYGAMSRLLLRRLARDTSDAAS